MTDPGGPRADGDDRPHVVAVSGSRRAGSNTRRALIEALSAVEGAGGTGELLDFAAVSPPPLDPDDRAVGDGAEVARRLREADAVILGTPMYHGSYAGVLKNAIDHCGSDEFEGKTVGLLAVSGGPFPTTALDHLRDVCRALHAWVLPHQVAIPHSNRAIRDGKIVDDAIRDRVQSLGERIVQHAAIEPEPVRPLVRHET